MKRIYQKTHQKTHQKITKQLHKKITKQLALCLLSLSLSLTACDDFLDKAPSSNLDEKTVFGVFANAQGYHNDIYAHLQQRFNAVGNFQPVPMASASDEADAQQGYHGTQSLNVGNYEGTDDNLYNYYEGIRKANTFITKEAIVPFPSDVKKNQMMGEVYFLRAFYFNEVVKRFGGMPIMTENNILFPNDNLNLSRNSYKECVDFMLQDLEKAIAILPTTLSENEYGRATKGAAMALKARVLLFAASPQWQKEMSENLWAKAADASKALIELTDNGSKVYELYSTGKGADDYERLFFLRREAGNKEIIFYKHENPVGFTDNQISVWAPKGGNLGGAGAVCPTQNFVDLFEMSNGKMIHQEGSGYDEQNPYANRDPRFYKTVLHNEMLWQDETMELFFNDSEEASGAHRKNKKDYTRTGYYVRKFLPEGVRNLTPNKESHNWIYFRLAEMYLNYAEASNEMDGPTTSVYEAINLVRNRSGQIELPSGLSQEEMRKLIFNERAVELSFEEHRWWDARRWGKAVEWFGGPMYEMEIRKQGNGFSYTPKLFYNRVYRSYMDLYPISRSELNKNILYKQNPGW